jgi:hypothetical protein
MTFNSIRLELLHSREIVVVVELRSSIVVSDEAYLNIEYRDHET